MQRTDTSNSKTQIQVQAARGRCTSYGYQHITAKVITRRYGALAVPLSQAKVIRAGAVSYCTHIPIRNGKNMSEDIDMLANAIGYSREMTIAKLKEHYDGYHFAKNSPDVFNPYSLLNCFAKRELGPYWFTSGTPAYLINMMRKYDTQPTDISRVEADESEFDAPTENITPLPTH